MALRESWSRPQSGEPTRARWRSTPIISRSLQVTCATTSLTDQPPGTIGSVIRSRGTRPTISSQLRRSEASWPKNASLSIRQSGPRYPVLDGQAYRTRVTREASVERRPRQAVDERLHRTLPKIAPAVTRWWPPRSSLAQALNLVKGPAAGPARQSLGG